MLTSEKLAAKVSLARLLLLRMGLSPGVERPTFWVKVRDLRPLNQVLPFVMLQHLIGNAPIPSWGHDVMISILLVNQLNIILYDESVNATFDMQL